MGKGWKNYREKDDWQIYSRKKGEAHGLGGIICSCGNQMPWPCACESSAVPVGSIPSLHLHFVQVKLDDSRKPK
jgi:hypothetical protein